jgi:hypothetical protein
VLKEYDLRLAVPFAAGRFRVSGGPRIAHLLASHRFSKATTRKWPYRIEKADLEKAVVALDDTER